MKEQNRTANVFTWTVDLLWKVAGWVLGVVIGFVLAGLITRLFWEFALVGWRVLDRFGI